MACADPLGVRDSWTHKITAGLSRLYKEQKLCDFTVTTNHNEDTHQSVECHRAVLAVASTYFADKLISGDRDNDINFLEVPDIEPSTLKEAVTFLYTGHCYITQHNVADLLDLGELWCVDALITECFGFMCIDVSTENCVAYYELCLKKNASTAVLTFVGEHIREHFAELQQNNTLVHLSEIGFTGILSRGRISKPVEHVMYDEINNENVVLEAVKKWLEANPSLSVDPLLPLIKYEYMTDEYLMDSVLDSPLLASEEKAHSKQLVKERLSKAKEKELVQSVNVTHQERGLLKVTNARNLCQLRDDDMKWKKIKKIPEWIDHGTAACVYGSQLIFVGSSSDDCRQCLILDTVNTRRSAQLPDLPSGAPSAGVAHTGRELYVNGGYPACSTVYRIDLHKRPLEWKKGTPMLYGVWCHKSWYHRGHVYVVGGRDTKGHTRSTQRYNISTDTWSQCADAPEDINAYHNKGLQINHEMHFFLLKQKVTYNCDTDQWSVKWYCSGYQMKKYTSPVMFEDGVFVLKSPDRYSDFEICKYYEVLSMWRDADIEVRDCLFSNMLF